jgi:two-component system NtrC family sensor kinase
MSSPDLSAEADLTTGPAASSLVLPHGVGAGPGLGAAESTVPPAGTTLQPKELGGGGWRLGRLSIRAKILLGFAVVLLTFGGATLQGAWAVHTLGQQLRLLALGYSNLRLELQDQQTLQANLQRRLAEPEPSERAHFAIAADRKLRRLRLVGAQQHVVELRRNLPKTDAEFLLRVEERLQQLEHLYHDADNQPLLTGSLGEPEGAGEALRRAEDQAAQLLQQLSSQLTNKVIEVVSAGERYEARAVAMTVVLALAAALVGGIVLWLVQRTLRPLRLLCESAREVARGNYRERVAADSPDEVGALGREFNAMAAALAEREQRLRRSEQLAAVGKLAAQITHEVRNPLTSIGLNAELLSDEFVDHGSEGYKVAQAIVREVDRLTEITEQYLRFARLPAPRFESTSVNDLVRSLLLFLGEELQNRGVRVELVLQEALPLVDLDDNQLRQTLLNLIRNAAEAMDSVPIEARQLRLQTRTIDLGQLAGSKRSVAIDVLDHGPGIPPELLRQIFEPFFTTKKGGTGLGLALAQEVVIRHGGELQVISPVPTLVPPTGTCFTIELPLSH